MTLLDLNEDLHRQICGFLDPLSFSRLSALDSYWASIAQTSKVHFDGPLTSTIFSIRSWLLNGPKYMPYVTTLDLQSCYANDINEEILLVALKRLRLEERRNLKLTLKICEGIYHMPLIRKYLTNFSYDEITFPGVGYFFYDEDLGLEEWTTKILRCSCEIYTLLTFHGLEDLELFFDAYTISINEKIAMQKAFGEVKLRSLITHGPFLDPDNMLKLPTSTSIQRLDLEGYSNSYFSWESAKAMQKSCPNLKQFKLIHSNLIEADLDYFDWSLWHLESLDLSYNYTLRYVKTWPVGLKELKVHNTGLNISVFDPRLFYQLEVLTTDMYASCEWAMFFESLSLKQVFLNMMHFLSGSHMLLGGPWFWRSLESSEVFVNLKESFDVQHTLKTVNKRLRLWNLN